MYLLNFIIAILSPCFGFYRISPQGTVPAYFFSDEGAFVAAEFGVVVFYWAGYLRNLVRDGNMTERLYFILASSLLVFMCASKIIFTLPYTWITSIFAFGLGVLSMQEGQQGMRGWLEVVIISASIIIAGFCSFILIGMAWFNFSPTAYFYYKILIVEFFHNITAVFLHP